MGTSAARLVRQGLLAVVVSLALAPPALAQTFQGGDGDQANPIIGTDWDWQGLAGRGVTVVHRTDNDLKPSEGVFDAGTETHPVDWQIGPGAKDVDNEDDIVDAWYAVETLGSDVWFYAGQRRANSGNDDVVHIAVELNRLRTAGLPCRSTGDLQITLRLNRDNSQAATDLRVDRWTTATNMPSGSQCAATGSFAPVTPVIGAQSDFNRTRAITNFLDPDNSPIQSKRFSELAVNLTQLQGGPDGCGWALASVWTHTRGEFDPESDRSLRDYDYVAPVPLLGARTCSASGMKFHDLDGDGAKDADEPGKAGVQIFADYAPYDGTLDADEPRTLTGPGGLYEIDGIVQSYVVRETPLEQEPTRDWHCTFPVTCMYGSPTAPLAADALRKGLNFGNADTGVLTLMKLLVPSNDPGLFNLLVDDSVKLANAGHNASVTVRGLTPGQHVVSESAGTGTNLADYTSQVACYDATGRSRSASASVSVIAGAPVSCQFTNSRIPPAPVPGIRITKTGPAGSHEWGADAELHDDRDEHRRRPVRHRPGHGRDLRRGADASIARTTTRPRPSIRANPGPTAAAIRRRRPSRSATAIRRRS